jgi:hypothetical protein
MVGLLTFGSCCLQDLTTRLYRNTIFFFKERFIHIITEINAVMASDASVYATLETQFV